MPARAAAPVPAMIAVGVARPSAQGQAITSTDTAAMMLCSMVPPASNQPSAVTMAIATTTGTKILVTLSTSRCTGGLAACAPSTSAMMRSRVDSLPTVVVSMRNSPSPLTLPPVTRSPGSLTTGMLSPVSSDSSTALSPDRIAPSTGIRSPGRTTTTSPVSTDVAGMVTTRRRARHAPGRAAAA